DGYLTRGPHFALDFHETVPGMGPCFVNRQLTYRQRPRYRTVMGLEMQVFVGRDHVNSVLLNLFRQWFARLNYLPTPHVALSKHAEGTTFTQRSEETDQIKKLL